MRKVGIVLSAFALAATLGACGDNSDDSGGGDSKPSAELVALAKSIGDQTAAASSAHMKITAEAGDQHINGEGDLKFGDSTAIAMDMSTGSGTVSIVYVDGVLFMKLPQELKPGKPWLKIAPDDKSELARSLGGLNEQLSKNADPRSALKEFENAGEITATKSETLDGQQVKHYTITVDVQKMADNQPDPTAKQAMQGAIGKGMTNFPVDVWVAETGLPVRFALQTPTPDGTGGMTSVKMQVDYTAWGAPVQIAAPPEDQTTAPPA